MIPKITPGAEITIYLTGGRLRTESDVADLDRLLHARGFERSPSEWAVEWYRYTGRSSILELIAYAPRMMPRLPKYMHLYGREIKMPRNSRRYINSTDGSMIVLPNNSFYITTFKMDNENMPLEEQVRHLEEFGEVLRGLFGIVGML